MWKLTKMKTLAVTMLVVGTMAGVVGAQAAQRYTRARFINTGLFTLGIGEEANFNVTLEDDRTGGPAQVLSRIIAKDGTVAARQLVTLRPGESATLTLDRPGVYRAQAEFYDASFKWDDRRDLLTSIEIFNPLDFSGTVRYLCKDDGPGSGRLPD